MTDLAAYHDANPYGRSIGVDDIRADLEFLDDWEDRYRYIIDLGKDLPHLPDAQKTESSIVHGCQSQVWLVCQTDADGRMQFAIDSDALIVRGLIAIVLAAFNHRTPAEIAATNTDALFDDLGLLRHLSPTRGNGLAAMVQRIRTEATKQ